MGRRQRSLSSRSRDRDGNHSAHRGPRSERHRSRSPYADRRRSYSSHSSEDSYTRGKRNSRSRSRSRDRSPRSARGMGTISQDLYDYPTQTLVSDGSPSYAPNPLAMYSMKPPPLIPASLLKAPNNSYSVLTSVAKAPTVSSAEMGASILQPRLGAIDPRLVIGEVALSEWADSARPTKTKGDDKHNGRDALEEERLAARNRGDRYSMSPPSTHTTSNELLLTQVSTCVNEEAIIRALRRTVAIYEGTHPQKYELIATWQPKKGNGDASSAPAAGEPVGDHVAHEDEPDDDLNDFLKDMEEDDAQPAAPVVTEIASSSVAYAEKGNGSEATEEDVPPFDDEEVDGVEFSTNLAITHLTPLLRRDAHHHAKPRNTCTAKTSFDVLPPKPPKTSDGIAWRYNAFGTSNERVTPFGVIITFATAEDCNRVLAAVRSQHCRKFMIVDTLMVAHRAAHLRGAARRKGGIFTSANVSALLINDYVPWCSLERIPTAERLKVLCEERDVRSQGKLVKPIVSILSPDHHRMAKDPSRAAELKAFLVSLYDSFSTLHEEDKLFYNTNMHIFTAALPTQVAAVDAPSPSTSITAPPQALSLKERLALKKQQLEAQKASASDAAPSASITEAPSVIMSPTSTAAPALSARELLMQKLAAKKSALASGGDAPSPSAELPALSHAEPSKPFPSAPLSFALDTAAASTSTPTPRGYQFPSTQPTTEQEDIALERDFYNNPASSVGGLDWYFRTAGASGNSSSLLYGFPLPPSTKESLRASLQLAVVSEPLAATIVQALGSAPDAGMLHTAILNKNGLRLAADKNCSGAWEINFSASLKGIDSAQLQSRVVNGNN